MIKKLKINVTKEYSYSGTEYKLAVKVFVDSKEFRKLDKKTDALGDIMPQIKDLVYPLGMGIPSFQRHSYHQRYPRAKEGLIEIRLTFDLKIKEYKDIDARVTTIKSRCQTLKDWDYSDDESFYGEDGVKCQKDLEALVESKCPEYLIQYKVNSKEFTKEDLLDMYKSKKYDDETNFFILSAIIDFSYEDGTYAYFLDEIVEYYDSISEEVKVTLSNYVHFKYMYAKCYTLALHSTVFYDKYYINLFNKQYPVS